MSDTGLGNQEAGTTDGPKSCKKIDFLFAIDKSPFMADDAHWQLGYTLDTRDRTLGACVVSSAVSYYVSLGSRAQLSSLSKARVFVSALDRGER